MTETWVPFFECTKSIILLPNNQSNLTFFVEMSFEVVSDNQTG